MYVWGQDGSNSEWSDPVTLEIGLLDVNDWEARFIGVSWDEEMTEPQPSPLLRREFTLRTGLSAELGRESLCFSIGNALSGGTRCSPQQSLNRTRRHFEKENQIAGEDD